MPRHRGLPHLAPACSLASHLSPLQSAIPLQAFASADTPAWNTRALTHLKHLSIRHCSSPLHAWIHLVLTTVLRGRQSCPPHFTATEIDNTLSMVYQPESSRWAPEFKLLTPGWTMSQTLQVSLLMEGSPMPPPYSSTRAEEPPQPSDPGVLRMHHSMPHLVTYSSLSSLYQGCPTHGPTHGWL